MKKLFLLGLLAAGFVSHAQSQQKAEKVGYANMEYIISLLPEVKEIENELKSTQTDLKKQIETRQQELQKQYTDFSENMNTMVDTVRENKQRELQASIAELEEMQQNAQKTLENQHKLYMAPVYLQVNRVIAEVARENGFAVILNQQVSGYRFLLYNNEQVDISNLVLQKFGVDPAAAK